MNLVENLITLLFYFKSVQSDFRCPFSQCTTIYSDSNFCNVYCVKIKLTDRGKSRLNQIGSFNFDQVSYIGSGIFRDLEISQLSFANALPQRIAPDAFIELKNIIRLTMKSISLDQFSIFQENLVFLRHKIGLLSVYNSISTGQKQLKVFLNACSYLKIKNLALFNISDIGIFLDLSNMTNLRSFVIYKLKNEKFSLKIHENMTEVAVENSNINELVIIAKKFGSNSKIFYFSSNKIAKLEIKFLTVDKIFLFKNSLNYLGKKNFILEHTNISLLDLSQNNLNLIEPEALRALEYVQCLKLGQNKLDQRTKFVNLSELVQLDLSSNKYSHFSQEFVFGCDKLEWLDLSNNNIENLNILESRSLLKINLNHNRIKFISDLKIPLISELYLEHNQLNSIDDVSLVLAKNLKKLILNKNKIESISYELLSSFDTLLHLELMDNKLKILNFPKLANLEILFLDKNNLKLVNRTNFGNLIALEILSLAQNEIQYVQTDSFINCKNMTKLYLDGNFLSEIPNVLMLPNLNYLSMNNQNGMLTEIKNFAFDNYLRDINLHLSHNNITYFSPHSFCMKNSSKSAILNLHLTSINFMHKCLLKQLDHRVQINLYYNKIDCYLQKFIDKYGYKIFSNFHERVCIEDFDDNCSEEANLQYNCGSNLKDFIADYSWVFLSDFVLSFSNQTFNCISVKNGTLFKYRDFKILLVEKKDHRCIEIMKNNKSIIFKGLNYLEIGNIHSNFEHLKLDKHKHLFYCSESDIYVVLGSFSEEFFDYVIVYTSKYVFDKSDGYLAKKFQLTSRENSSNCTDFEKFINISQFELDSKDQFLSRIDIINRTIILLDEYKNDRSKKYSESNFDYFRRVGKLNGCSSEQLINIIFYYSIFFIFYF